MATPIDSIQERLLRTADDEASDKELVIRNLALHVYENWPTEAGFDGLREERGPIEIPVSGTIPPWAAGNLYRTGPGQCKVEDTPTGTHYFSHWFDGLAHSHRFEIIASSTDGRQEDGEVRDKAKRHGTRVFYSSRRQSEPLARIIQKKGAKNLFSFAQRRDPCVSFLGKFMSTFLAATLAPRLTRPRDTENVSVVVLTNTPLPDCAKKDYKEENNASQPSRQQSSGHRSSSALPSNVWISTDASVLRQVDPETLEPIGVAIQDTLHPDLRGTFSSAHAQRDPISGDLYNFNLEIGPTSTYRVFRVSSREPAAGATPQSTTEILATIRCSPPGGPIRPAYIHSLFLTPHYVILCIPCSHIAMSGLKILWERNITDGIVPFDPSNKTRWIVIDRRPGSLRGVVADFESDAGFFFHSVNAFEEETAVPETLKDRDATEDKQTALICDVIDYPSFDVVRTFYYDVVMNRRGAANDLYCDEESISRVLPSLSRYRLVLPKPSFQGQTDKKNHDAHPSLVAERLWSIPAPHSGDLPTINPQYATAPHRYVYSLSSRGKSTLADGLVKVDTQTHTSLLWPAPEKNVPGEAIFVPRPRTTDLGGADDKLGDEDDGVLLCVVLDGSAGESYLLCLDAHTMTEMGRAHVGLAIGLGFHGTHVSSSL